MTMICFLSSAHPPLDKRVFAKEARALADAGFAVMHVAPGAEAREYRRDGVRIVEYVARTGLVRRCLRLPRLYALGARVRADVYHCNEIDSWLVGMALKLRFGSKVVFDVHEHYPSTFLQRTGPRYLRGLLAGMIRLLYAVLTPVTDRIVFAKAFVAKDFPVHKEQSILVRNLTPRALGGAKADQKEERNGTIRAIHTGLFGVSRGWPQLVTAARLMAAKDVEFEVLGEVNDGSLGDFQTALKEAAITERFAFVPWQPFEKAFQHLLRADIGLILFQPGIRNHVYASPHKLYDYMLAALPVIGPGFALEVAEVISEVGCGMLVDTSDPEAIAAALDRLASDPSLCREMGNKGRRAVLERYNWEAEAATLIRMYDDLAPANRRRLQESGPERVEHKLPLHVGSPDIKSDGPATPGIR